jgi:pimeloyl-ACP methyl ester carboxylesterase
MKIRFRLREHLRRLWAATLAALVAEDPCEHDLYRWITCDCPGCGHGTFWQGRRDVLALRLALLALAGEPVVLCGECLGSLVLRVYDELQGTCECGCECEEHGD